MTTGKSEITTGENGNTTHRAFTRNSAAGHAPKRGMTEVIQRMGGTFPGIQEWNGPLTEWNRGKLQVVVQEYRIAQVFPSQPHQRE